MATANQQLSNYDAEKISSASNMKIAIVVSEWNQKITNGLLDGAKETLLKEGIIPKDLQIHYVPGSYELPIGAQFILEKGSIDAVICLGCVIQGETKHFDFVCQGISQGIKDVSLKYNRPVIFGVLTDNTEQQSIDRSGGKLGNKGVEAAITAIKMVALQKQIENT